MRAVLDTNVIVSAVISTVGSPAALLGAWRNGRIELIVSPLLLAELERVLAYPKLRDRISIEDAGAVMDLLRRAATVRPDPDGPPPLRSVDPGDDYILALAASEQAVLVSGDGHLLALRGSLPILAPASFLEALISMDRTTGVTPDGE